MKILLFISVLALGASAPLRENRAFDLLGGLTGLTQGTSLGTAFSILDSLNKISQVVTDLKQFVPLANQTVHAGLNEIHGTISDILIHVLGTVGGAAPQNRAFDLLGGLTGLTQGTSLGTALSILDSINKISQVVTDLKQFVPAANQTVHAGLNAIHGSLTDIMTHVLGTIGGSAPTRSFDLLGGLTGLTQGTSLGTALSILDSINKISQVVTDLKQFVPAANQTVHAGLNAIHGSLTDIMTHVLGTIGGSTPTRAFDLLGGLTGLTQGTSLGTALSILDSLNKISQVVTDLKQFVPAANETVHAGLNAIHGSISDIMTHVLGTIAGTTPTRAFDLLGGLTGLTQGTSLGTALSILDSINKISQVVTDLKQFVPAANETVHAGLNAIHGSISDIMTHVLGTIAGSTPTRAFDLLGGLTGLTQGTSLGTALSILDSLNKISQVVTDLKQFVPAANQTVHAGLNAIHGSISDILTHVLGTIGTTTPTRSFDLLGGLTGLTQGTSLGTALSILDSINKISQVVTDLKQFVPAANETVHAGLNAIHGSISDIMTHVLGTIAGTTPTRAFDLLGGLTGLTQGTGLGTTLSILDSINKISQVVTDLKQFVPVANQTVHASLNQIHSGLSQILSGLLTPQ